MKRESERPAYQPPSIARIERGRAAAEELLDYARRYFAAAAHSPERRKMQVLVKLGLEYLKLAAQAERPRRPGRATARVGGASLDSGPPGKST